ncbi:MULTISPECIES: hypothetical protein [unclassified Pseudomonas]|uniref:hypothetical protein n=1 Tax=unclassified Pseudomonas TaxID=196821 RepID=UPI00244C2368|nr:MULTISPECIES: hypothetical protein [unclassified Pseudomonas]MDH0892833.1 hypothetical protein [Pseudomonas sp. GD03875]MDH1064693.1 hypothetical protein [Pseudomonas sp. GD03985]
MPSTVNTLKALIISAAVAAFQILYFASSSFQEMLVQEGRGVSKLEAIIEASRTMDIWPRIFEGWLQSFIVAILACILLLLTLSHKKQS